jgi:hypothetical protein
MEFQLSNVCTRAALDIGISSHRVRGARDARPLPTSLHQQTGGWGDEGEGGGNRRSTRVR